MKQQWSHRWHALRPQDKRALTWGLGCGLVLLVWALGIDPALREGDSLQRRYAALQQQVVQASAIESQVSRLRNQPPQRGQQNLTLDWLEASLAVAQVQAEQQQLDANRVLIRGDRQSADQVLRWLEELSAQTRSTPQRVVLHRLGSGLVRFEIYFDLAEAQ